MKSELVKQTNKVSDDEFITRNICKYVMPSTKKANPSDSGLVTITATVAESGNIGCSQFPYLEGKGFEIIKDIQTSRKIGGKWRNWIASKDIASLQAELAKHANVSLELVAISAEQIAENEAKYGKRNADAKSKAKAKRASVSAQKAIEGALNTLIEAGVDKDALKKALGL